MRTLFYCVFIFTQTNLLLSQNSLVDSLKKLLLTEKRDTVILELKGSIGEALPILRIGYWDSLSKEAHKANSKRHEAYFLLNAGYVAVNQGDVIRSVNFYEKSLKLFEQLNNQKGLANAFNNLGFVYEGQGDYENALANYKKGLDIRLANNLKKASVTSYNNIGSVYLKIKNYVLAENYFEKGLKIAVEIKFNSLESQIKHNLGVLKIETNDYKSAIVYFEEALKIREADNDEEGISYTKLALSKLYFFELNQKQIGKTYAEEALILANKIKFPIAIRNAAEILSKIYLAEKNYQKAFNASELYHLMKDSINNDETRSASIKHQFKYEYEKQAAADSLTHAKESEIKNAEIDKQQVEIKAKKNQQYALIFGLFLVLLFTTFIFNRFKVTQKQKQIIEIKEQETQKQNIIITQQKQLVEEHQKEILDSINYAKKIQYALLAHDDLLKQNLPEHFIFFKPKDIVSGDFYWATEHNNKFYLAVCDSTGHGVPGAFMSLLNIGFLSEAIKEKNIILPNEVLNYVRSRLMQSIGNDGQQDGMDAILLCIDKKQNTITYAAANNEPVLIRDNEVVILPKDKMPVGKGERNESFKLQTIVLNEGDTLFLYTDGYADQFGGPKGKKFKYKQLNDLLLEISAKPSVIQAQLLNETMVNWKGNLEQVDDICVIGIKI